MWTAPRASQLGLNQKEVVGNVITALTSNTMIAPSYWIDPKTGNDYMLTVQYPETQIKSLLDLKSIPLRSAGGANSTQLDMLSRITRIQSPTEVDHYQLRRTIDVFVRPLGEDLGQIAGAIDRLIARTKIPANVRVDLRGMVQGMRASFRSFALGLMLSLVLLYLILVAQFRSFLDPFLILLAVPTGLTGVLITLYITGTTLNVMSLMGVVMLAGIVVSNSILIVEFTHRLEEDGMGGSRSRSPGLPRAIASGADDLARHHDRPASHGLEAGRRQRSLCPAGAGHHRRPHGFGDVDGIRRSGCLRPVPRKA